MDAATSPERMTVLGSQTSRKRDGLGARSEHGAYITIADSKARR